MIALKNVKCFMFEKQVLYMSACIKIIKASLLSDKIPT